jgi:hypothetical protein
MGRIDKSERYRKQVEYLAFRINHIKRVYGVKYDRLMTDVECWNNVEDD